jgi:hypothetical protein
LACVRVNDSHDREVDFNWPAIGTIASDVVSQVRVPGKEKDQISLAALLRDMKASPALELLQSNVPRDGQSSWTDAVHVNGIRLHDFGGQRRALSFLGKRRGNQNCGTKKDPKKSDELSHQCRV